MQTTREKVLNLHNQNIGPTAIARKLNISRQRVHQILKDPEGRPRGRKPSMTQAEIDQALGILKSRDSWTWVEAEQAIADAGILVPAMKIYDMFRALGFKKIARNSPTWVKQ